VDLIGGTGTYQAFFRIGGSFFWSHQFVVNVTNRFLLPRVKLTLGTTFPFVSSSPLEWKWSFTAHEFPRSATQSYGVDLPPILSETDAGSGAFDILIQSPVGKTIDINDHAGVDAFRFTEGRQDLEISVKFNFVGETAEKFNVWMDDKDYKGSHAGHICSVFISPTSGNISDAKTGNFENTIYEKRKGGGTLDEATEEMLKTKTVSFPLDLKRHLHFVPPLEKRLDQRSPHPLLILLNARALL
jgi:hypothetical protein